jgi:hypothetical protein
MEVFRTIPLSSVMSDWVVSTSLVVDDDVMVRNITVDVGVTMTVNSGVTITCEEFTCNGTVINNGTIIAQSVVSVSAIAGFLNLVPSISTSREAFRAVTPAPVLADPPSMTTTEESFRAVTGSPLEVFP